MTQATSDLTRVADAILALINSRPRTPTRAEIVAAITQHTGTQPQCAWQPTALGRALLAELPGVAAAARADAQKNDVRSSPGYIGEEACERIESACAAAYTRVDKIARAIFDRPESECASRAHLVDLALIANLSEGSRRKINESTEYFDTEDIAIGHLVLTVLAQAGIRDQDCTISAHYERLERAQESCRSA